VVLLAIVQNVVGHTIMTNLVIDGNEIDTCLRPKNPYIDQWPVSGNATGDPTLFDWGLTGENMTCGFQPFASQPAQSKCSVNPGQTIGMTFFHGGYDGDYIALSHKGPIMAYLAKSDTGAGPVWFKIYQVGLLGVYPTASPEEAKTRWASADLLEAQNGVIYFEIPSDISPGNYLLRTELISLHDTRPHGAQTYVRCAELTISGTGTSNPPGVTFPGAYGYYDAGIFFSPWDLPYKPQSEWVYPFPGPAVYVPGQAPVTSGALTTDRPITSQSMTTQPVTSSPLTTNSFKDCEQGNDSDCPENSFCNNGVCNCNKGFTVVGGGCVEAVSSGSSLSISFIFISTLYLFL